MSLFVLPSFPALAPVLDCFANTPVGVGGQNLYQAPPGAYTGEVSGAMLAEMGCRYVEIAMPNVGACSQKMTLSSPPRHGSPWRRG